MTWGSEDWLDASGGLYLAFPGRNLERSWSILDAVSKVVEGAEHIDRVYGLIGVLLSDLENSAVGRGWFGIHSAIRIFV